jgi:hypothetical protein
MALVIDMRGKAIFVAAYIEYRQIACSVGVWVCFPDIHDAIPAQPFDCPIPIVERLLGGSVLIRKVEKSFATDNVHDIMLSK